MLFQDRGDGCDQVERVHLKVFTDGRNYDGIS